MTAASGIENLCGPADLSTRDGTPYASRWRSVMLDALYMAIGFGFLAVAVLYVVACDRL
jgi:hypothetical protein